MSERPEKVREALRAISRLRSDSWDDANVVRTTLAIIEQYLDEQEARIANLERDIAHMVEHGVSAAALTERRD